VKIRLLAALAALVLAVVGAALVTVYVQGADARALAGAKAVDVFVVAKAVPANTPAESLPSFLKVQALPATAVAADGLSTLDGTTGTVTAVDLAPGEQLLRSRLVDPSSMVVPGTVPVPVGLQEVTVLLDPQRTVGGRLAAGDTVGIFVSVDVGSTTATPLTHQLFHTVLITSIQGAPTDAAASGSAGVASAGSASASAPSSTSTGTQAPAVPAGSMLVTFARTAADVEKIIFAAENESIWLSKEPAGADLFGTRPVTTDGLFQ
jgi:pilus assembly protein CpaB